MNEDNLSEAAYKHISSKLLRSKLIPGQKISEPGLAKELGISRTPVRAAILRLQNEGVVRQIPSSGTYVAQPARVPLMETYEVRMALETMAVKKAAKRIKPKELTELKKCCDKMKSIIKAMPKENTDDLQGSLLEKFLSADLAFHLTIMRIADNHMATELITSAYMRNRIFGHHCIHRDLAHTKRTLETHSKIVKAIEDHDPDTAYKRLHDHIELSMNEALEVLDEQYYMNGQ